MSIPSSVVDAEISRGSAEGAVSWGAVLAGAAGAAALSLVLIILGTGLGLAVISPWGGEGASAEALGLSTILWITLVQALASVLGGYLAGRLRTRWLTVHSNEVFFRDTAHGFLAWAVATLLMATLLSSAIAATLSSGVKVAGAVAGTAATAVSVAASKADEAGNGASGADPLGYYVDMAFRESAQASTQAPPEAAAPETRDTDTGEVTRAFAQGLSRGELTEGDVKQLGKLVASRTGLPQADAERRVSETFTQLKSSADEASAKARQAADDARKASAYAALWLVVSLLLGAFLASFAATFGGRLRDSSVHHTRS
jgi:hypothetical protein